MYSMHVYYKQNNRICEKEAFARMNECEWNRNRRRIHWAAATIVDAGLISASQHDVDLLRINENSALQCRKANTNGPNADPQVNKVGKKKCSTARLVVVSSVFLYSFALTTFAFISAWFGVCRQTIKFLLIPLIASLTDCIPHVEVHKSLCCSSLLFPPVWFKWLGVISPGQHNQIWW